MLCKQTYYEQSLILTFWLLLTFFHWLQDILPSYSSFYSWDWKLDSLCSAFYTFYRSIRLYNPHSPCIWKFKINSGTKKLLAQTFSRHWCLYWRQNSDCWLLLSWFYLSSFDKNILLDKVSINLTSFITNLPWPKENEKNIRNTSNLKNDKLLFNSMKP